MFNKKLIYAFLLAMFCSTGITALAQSHDLSPDSEANLSDEDEASYIKRRLQDLQDAKEILFKWRMRSLLPRSMGFDLLEENASPPRLPDGPFTGELAAVLPAKGRSNHVSQSLESMAAFVVLAREARIEIYLPTNRCESGYVKWGDARKGYRKCRVLGRGESMFGTVEELSKLKAAKPKTYGTWILGEMPSSIKKVEAKEVERLGAGATYEHCMYKPEIYSQGASISFRPNSSVGLYKLDTGRAIHAGKSKWGKRDGRYLLPVRMNKIPDARNDRFAGEGDLIKRYDFWLHSHENENQGFALEALSTWGCVRMPQNCQIDLQAWVASQNASGIQPEMIVYQDDQRVVNFANE